eukprot:CAMPEP_0198154326 /NCGR_PEP_ID=MMETSP1443-20131203/68229_1 /TAXON_ID=186043 /ORGANISM="Entomoneis sp., Strain CCMP2396" /LENGTH=351 /DNA_ID=CAMNT_0043820979 /DNA_START=66 /DNA_END=1122 /DNA_ORIENTATION=-
MDMDESATKTEEQEQSGIFSLQASAAAVGTADKQQPSAAASEAIGTVSTSTVTATPATPIRLNKIFKATHSRREADKLVQEGRVTVNGVVSTGCMVTPFQDVVTLDGTIVQGWEGMNGIIINDKNNKNNINNNIDISTEDSYSDSSSDHEQYEYIKYYKPRGIICTTDQRIENNIIHALTTMTTYHPKHRVFPVGRLDKDSSGLILITSDGRLPNASLRSKTKQPKRYQVTVNKAMSESDIQQLRSGIVITTIAQRQHNPKPLTAPTKPCQVERLSRLKVEITLTEGRNRQIRKMMAVLGYQVIALHRVSFGEIQLDPDMKPGDWKQFSAQDMHYVDSILIQQQEQTPDDQ